MATKANDHVFLLTERSGYETQRKKPKAGWNDMTQTGTYDRMFDGMRARPFTSQLAGSPKARAKSGARSLSNWQRDYNTKGLCDEKVQTFRFQRVVKMKQEAIREADRRMIPVEAVEEEMYQALRARSTRIDTGLRKDDMTAPSRTYPSGGGPPRLFDGSEKLEEGFSFKDARDMFRGEAWEMMSETLSKVDPFKPPPRSLEEANRLVLRGSFSLAVTPAELQKAQEIEMSPKKSPKKKDQDNSIGAADLLSLKKLLVRKYGSITAAWRHVLDQDGNGRLSFAEWSKALRMVGFEGNIKAAYKQLDDDGSGNVSFAEFEPDLAERMKEFRLKLELKYGEDMDVGWRQIDDNGNNMLDRDEFEEVCELIGYPHKSWELFKELRFHPSRKFLSVEDFKAIPQGY